MLSIYSVNPFPEIIVTIGSCINRYIDIPELLFFAVFFMSVADCSMNKVVKDTCPVMDGD